MEINPRLSQSIEIARQAGVDFARMQLEWARGGHLDRVTGYRIGVRVGWLAGDARFAVSALRGSGSPAPTRRDAARIGRDYLTGTRIEGLELVRPAAGAVRARVQRTRAREAVRSVGAGRRRARCRGTRRPCRWPG